MKNQKMTYTNNQKINQMIENKNRFKFYTVAFTTLAIFSEIPAAINAPNFNLAGCAIFNLLCAGIAATKMNNLNTKIKEYKKSHKISK